ncbi:stimulus-sensing domain-containing protein [Kiloniella laminariae]|uniref:stimulus-sensing domain-containing protein n=1 Tax=Kiloniella laminariae TaxID=454162 RepID=UPI000381991E|nr:stimulus-sensing domain-containing protein [Kiloniella laminariae]
MADQSHKQQVEIAQAVKKHRKGRKRGWRSSLTRKILLINSLVLLIPVVGLMHLEQYRLSLIASELDALSIQGRAFSLSLGSTAVVASKVGDEKLVPELTRSLMRGMLNDIGVRARIFATSGEMLADSLYLAGVGGPVEIGELPPPGGMSLDDRIIEYYEKIITWLPGRDDWPLYRESQRQSAEDYKEVLIAMKGEPAGMVRADTSGRLVLSMAVPIQRYRQVLGTLMLSKDAQVVTEAVQARRRDILAVCGIALGVTVLLSLYLAGTIGRPLRRLADAADFVRYGKGRQYEIPDFTRRRDEIGDLSGALRAMTEALWARMDAIEGFAADVAHEIKNPLTSLRSAVETVARVSDPDQQKRLMAIILDDVQRLDRLISDISDASRLDAELSRANMEDVDVRKLLETLVEIQRVGLDGKEGPSFELRQDETADLCVPGLEGRLGQVLRNLMSNAQTFSPPDGKITLIARRDENEVVITVEDEGPGIIPGKLEAIFDRFYTERPEGEKFGTHSGLGLSISKQIIEAHNGTITAENREGAGGKIRGARFIITLPVG